MKARPESATSLYILKDAGGWYADVLGHTRDQNAMVCGADTLIERLSEGDNKVTVKFRTVAAPEDGPLGRPIMHLRRIMHDPFGATYVTRDFGWLPRGALNGRRKMKSETEHKSIESPPDSAPRIC